MTPSTAPRRAYPSPRSETPATVATDAAPQQLYPGDVGELSMASRRVLVQLVKGPYVSATSHPQLWAALVADEKVIRSRLADLFLRLVLDRDAGLAFVAAADSGDSAVPSVIRSTRLTLIDTALALFLRERLLRSETSGARVIVGRDEINDQLRVYQPAANTDAVNFDRRINASVEKMKKNSILLRTREDDRYEISPILGLVFGADEVLAVARELRRLLNAPPADAGVVELDEEAEE